MNTPLFLLVAILLTYAAAAAGLGIYTHRVAGKNGRNRLLACTLSISGFFCGIAPGIIISAIYTLAGPRSVYCPKCGSQNIFYLASCRSCQTTLKTSRDNPDLATS